MGRFLQFSLTAPVSSAHYSSRVTYNCFVYMLTTSRNTALYTGVTSNLPVRLAKHRRGDGSHFTRIYNVWKLVYFEQTTDIRAAIAREKQIKNMSRAEKEKLINSFNPEWRDLGEEVGGREV